jgi:hypothetical protein
MYPVLPGSDRPPGRVSKVSVAGFSSLFTPVTLAFRLFSLSSSFFLHANVFKTLIRTMQLCNPLRDAFATKIQCCPVTVSTAAAHKFLPFYTKER